RAIRSLLLFFLFAHSAPPELYTLSLHDALPILFFQAALKYKVRYATLGFQPDAHLDDGNMWATSFAVTAIGPAEEKLIRELVERSEEHTSELQSRENLVCRLLLEKKKNNNNTDT